MNVFIACDAIKSFQKMFFFKTECSMHNILHIKCSLYSNLSIYVKLFKNMQKKNSASFSKYGILDLEYLICIYYKRYNVIVIVL